MANQSFTSNFAGMSKSQLYDIMSQMKILTEQNQQQAKQILIDNPALTKALFQAQIMLGMVNPPKAVPSMQPAPSQPLQQSVQPVQPQSTPAPSLPVQAAPPDQASGNQMQPPARKQANHLVQSISSASALPGPPVTHQPQTMPSHPQQFVQQAKGHMNTQGMPISHPQSSHVHSMPPQQLHSSQQPPFHQSQVPTIFNQPQQSLHSSGSQHHPLQPPLPPQPRPPSMQPFLHQPHQQMGPHSGFQNSGASQPHHQQPPFSAANMHPGGSGFAHGQPSFPNQPPPQPMYQVGGSHLGRDFNNQGGGPMQVDRAPWMPGPPENTTGGVQLPGPPPLPSQVGPGSQPPSATPPTPNEMERALLQQVMNLTPEQINLLPPEQRQQVFQLQQMLR